MCECLCNGYTITHSHSHVRFSLVYLKASCASIVSLFQWKSKVLSTQFNSTPSEIFWLAKHTDNHVHAQHYLFHNDQSRKPTQDTSPMVSACFSLSLSLVITMEYCGSITTSRSKWIVQQDVQLNGFHKKNRSSCTTKYTLTLKWHASFWSWLIWTWFMTCTQF